MDVKRIFFYLQSLSHYTFPWRWSLRKHLLLACTCTYVNSKIRWSCLHAFSFKDSNFELEIFNSFLEIIHSLLFAACIFNDFNAHHSFEVWDTPIRHNIHLIIAVFSLVTITLFGSVTPMWFPPKCSKWEGVWKRWKWKTQV